MRSEKNITLTDLHSFALFVRLNSKNQKILQKVVKIFANLAKSVRMKRAFCYKSKLPIWRLSAVHVCNKIFFAVVICEKYVNIYLLGNMY